MNGGLSGDVPCKIVNMFLLHRAKALFATKYAVGTQVKEFRLEVASDRRLKTSTKIQHATVVNNGRVRKSPNEIGMDKRTVQEGLLYPVRALQSARDAYTVV